MWLYHFHRFLFFVKTIIFFLILNEKPIFCSFLIVNKKLYFSFCYLDHEYALFQEQVLKKEHQTEMSQLKAKMQTEIEAEKKKTYCDERTFEKLRCEKRLLEDKYKCLKEKYFRLKTEVKLSIEKRNRRKEQSTTNTTGSETEQSNSNNKDR